MSVKTMFDEVKDDQPEVFERIRSIKENNGQFEINGKEFIFNTPTFNERQQAFMVLEKMGSSGLPFQTIREEKDKIDKLLGKVFFDGLQISKDKEFFEREEMQECYMPLMMTVLFGACEPFLKSMPAKS